MVVVIRIILFQGHYPTSSQKCHRHCRRRGTSRRASMAVGMPKEFRLLVVLVCSARNKLAPWVPSTASQVSQGKQTTPRDTQRRCWWFVRLCTVHGRLMSRVENVSGDARHGMARRLSDQVAATARSASLHQLRLELSTRSSPGLSLFLAVNVGCTAAGAKAALHLLNLAHTERGSNPFCGSLPLSPLEGATSANPPFLRLDRATITQS